MAWVNKLGFPVNRWVSLQAHQFRLTNDGSPRRWLRPCVYALYRDGRLVYIGCSVNVYSRLVAHRGTIGYDSFKLKFLTDSDEHKPLERRLIDRLRPIENRVIPRRARG